MKPYFDLANTPLEIGDIVYSEYYRRPAVVMSGNIGIFNTSIKCFDGNSRHTFLANDKNVFHVYVLPQYRNYNNDDITKIIIPDETRKFSVSVPDNRFEVIEPIIKAIERFRKRGFVKDYYYYSNKTSQYKQINGKSYYDNDVRFTILGEQVKARLSAYAYSSKQPFVIKMIMENTSIKILDNKKIEIVNPIITGHDNALESKELTDRLFELVDDCEKS